jgi:hypothetical protein
MLCKKRPGLAIIICIILALALGSPVAALDQASLQEIAESRIKPMPMMTYINQIATAMYIDTYGDTTAYGSILGYPGVTDEVWIFLYLEQYVNGSWVTYASWSQVFYSYRGTLERYRVVPHGYYYRVRGSYYAWSGSNYEHMYGYSSSQYY